MSLLAALDQGVLPLTLNRPEKRNALDRGTIAGLRQELQGAALDAAVRVVVIRGAGKDFCAATRRSGRQPKAR